VIAWHAQRHRVTRPENKTMPHTCVAKKARTMRGTRTNVRETWPATIVIFALWSFLRADFASVTVTSSVDSVDGNEAKADESALRATDVDCREPLAMVLAMVATLSGWPLGLAGNFCLSGKSWPQFRGDTQTSSVTSCHIV
jgi:hypothetical protein